MLRKIILFWIVVAAYLAIVFSLPASGTLIGEVNIVMDNFRMERVNDANAYGVAIFTDLHANPNVNHNTTAFIMPGGYEGLYGFGVGQYFPIFDTIRNVSLGGQFGYSVNKTGNYTLSRMNDLSIRNEVQSNFNNSGYMNKSMFVQYNRGFSWSIENSTRTLQLNNFGFDLAGVVLKNSSSLVIEKNGSNVPGNVLQVNTTGSVVWAKTQGMNKTIVVKMAVNATITQNATMVFTNGLLTSVTSGFPPHCEGTPC